MPPKKTTTKKAAKKTTVVPIEETAPVAVPKLKPFATKRLPADKVYNVG
jgi:hypothetical protein